MNNSIHWLNATGKASTLLENWWTWKYASWVWQVCIPKMFRKNRRNFGRKCFKRNHTLKELRWNSEHVREALTPKRHAKPWTWIEDDLHEINDVIQSQSQWEPEDALALAHVQNSAPVLVSRFRLIFNTCPEKKSELSWILFHDISQYKYNVNQTDHFESNLYFGTEMKYQKTMTENVETSFNIRDQPYLRAKTGCARHQRRDHYRGLHHPRHQHVRVPRRHLRPPQPIHQYLWGSSILFYFQSF